MYFSKIQIRVRYGETDRMGYVYYGNYAEYFEVARVETLRNIGFNYKQLEEQGVMLPVLNYSVKYIRPAFYDDLLTIRTVITKLPTARIHFEYEIYNEKDELINTAETTLVFINRNSNRPCPAPPALLELLKIHF
ncbi:MAG: acyl-CoA thioesterase [Bacteroidia bacterium]|nr:acyl-CoA thioesterase [Bacteroidia bacterium]